MDLAAAFQQGLDHHRAGRLDDAKRIYGEILAVAADHFDTLHALALAEFQSGNPGRAVDHLALALAANPPIAPAHNNYGVILNALGRFDDAIATLTRAIAIDANYTEAYLHRGRAFGSLGRIEEARADFEQALRLNPNHPAAHNDLGKVLGAAGAHAEAIAHFDRAKALAPDFAEAHANHTIALAAIKQSAGALAAAGQLEEALAAFDHALAFDPTCAATHNNRGVALLRLGRPDDALSSYRRAGEVDPAYGEAFVNAAATLNDLKRHDEALVAAKRAIELRPKLALAYQIRGAAFDALGRYDEAIADYDAALAIDPTIELLPGRRLFLRQLICRWDGLDQEIKALSARIDAGGLPAAPFYLHPIGAPLAQQKQLAERYCAAKVAAPARPTLSRHPQRDKIRVGYFSADFRTHAVSHLMAGLFETHDRAVFEVIGFNLSRTPADDMTRRLQAAFDQFVDISRASDMEAARFARDMELDIAVDLTGHTLDGRPGLFAQRVAPVQVSYLGFPGTSGLPAMDYMLADDVLIPAGHRPYYSEKIAYLPSYQVNDWKRAVPGPPPSRQACGLPERGFVFCGFNNTYKITPDLFDVWMRLLQKVDSSVLWLRETSDAAVANLRKEAERRGVAASRLIFAPRMPMADHLARHQAADLFLDSFIYNAHTTASDALWSGLPVLTRLGDTFAGRGAASVLIAAGLPELIAHTVDEYEALAFDLATHPEKIANLKRRLHEARATCALFDTVRFARNIEAAFRRMMDIHARGAAPEDFRISEAKVHVRSATHPRM